MKTLSTIILTLVACVGLQANVIGPNKDGIYKVDKLGSQFNAKKKRKLRYDHESTEKHLQIKTETAIL